jgi:hypothetical protein
MKSLKKSPPASNRAALGIAFVLAMGCVERVQANHEPAKWSLFTVCVKYQNGMPYTHPTKAATWHTNAWHTREMPGTADGCRNWTVSVNQYVSFAATHSVGQTRFSTYGWSEVFHAAANIHYRVGSPLIVYQYQL